MIYTTLKISEMLKGGAEVVEKDGKKRPCSPSDFCVLVRNNSYINTYVDELNRIGIPAKGNEETGYLRSREIAVLIDLLRIISNPLQDISMAAVMTSPMYMFSVMDIAVIKSFDRQRALFPIIRGLADGEYPECTDMFLRERCVDFLDSIDNFRLDSVTMTIGELIGEIYDSTDFISVMQLYNDGEKKRANLRALILYAENYESMASYDGSGGLNGFLRHIDRVMENGDYAQGKVSASSGEFVTVQTLHRSKGLEYPFVFIAETSVKFKFDSKSVMCNTDGRIGYVLYDPVIYRKYKTFQQTMLSAEEEKDTRSEEMRLLYVGLTRAQQKLFINMKCGEKALKRAESLIESCVLHNGDIDEAVSEAKSFSDWLWLGIIRDPLFAKIAEQLEINTDEMSFARKSCSKLWDYEIISELKREKAEETDEDYEEIPDENLVLRLKDIISYNYNKTLSEMPAKLSVTEITKKLNNSDEVFDFKLKRPRFMSAVNKLTGSERGTAIHTFFQYCNFDKEVSDVDFEIDEVKKKGFISAVEAEAINRDNALAFFKSDLYRRIRNSLHYVREKKFMVAVRELDIEEDIIGMLSNSDGMIRGIIDLMFEEVDGIVILDYKTDKGISLQKMKERYSTQ